MLEGSGLRCELLDLSTVRSSWDKLFSTAKDLADSADVLICDAETATDMEAIAEVAAKLGERAVWVGSAG